MSGQDGTEATTEPRRNRQVITQKTTLQRPANDDEEAWRAYWKAQGQPWRAKPEIDVERQKYIDERRNITPDIEKGVYPFKDVDPKLSRADVEWLLATHENGRGPVNWKDESQREREGLDLRGADLRQENLSRLPLARMRGGLPNNEFGGVGTDEQRSEAAIHLEGANLRGAQLQGADLMAANLQQANLWQSDLHEACLGRAQLQGANLRAELLDIFGWKAQLQGANLNGANLREAMFVRAQLQGADLSQAQLDGIALDGAILSDEKYGAALLSDIRWGEINLTVVDWGRVPTLGDEQAAHQKKDSQGQTKDKEMRVREYKTAVRANRQLSVILRSQGLNEDAARFGYRAQLLQRKVFWYERKFAKYLGSLFLDLLSGYGYKPLRCFIAYAIVISIFAIIYYLFAPQLVWNEAIVISMTAFHGRGFFPEQFHPGDPQALVAAIEAFVGLLIEVTFIATLTQRLFGK